MISVSIKSRTTLCLTHVANQVTKLMLDDITAKLTNVGNPRQPWILHFTPWLPDSRYLFPVFESENWILDSNLQWDSRFIELHSGFQGPGFRIPQQKVPRFWNSNSLTWGDATCKISLTTNYSTS